MKQSLYPTTTRQAFRILDELISPEEMAEFLEQSKEDFVTLQHFDLGMWIRNNWIYGGSEDESPEEREQRDKCYQMLSGNPEGAFIYEHPDSISERFLKKYYDHLKRVFVNKDR